MNKAQLEEAVELVEKHQLFRLDKNFNERLAALIAEVRATQPPQDERGQGDCGNSECGWRGPIAECSYLGGVGPCCPKCREIVEPDVDPEQPVALSTLTDERPIDDEVTEAMRIVDWEQFGMQSFRTHYAALARAALQSFGSQLEAVAMDNDLAMGDRLQRIVAQIAEWRKS